ncbi:unnamed protein product [Candida parapsilosis]
MDFKCVVVFALITLYYLIRWQRQIVDFPSDQPARLQKFIMGGIYPMLGWVLHFMPFVIMGRVTYVHHYVPALYFAMIVFCFEIELWTSKLNKKGASAVSKVALPYTWRCTLLLVLHFYI